MGKGESYYIKPTRALAIKTVKEVAAWLSDLNYAIASNPLLGDNDVIPGSKKLKEDSMIATKALQMFRGKMTKKDD